MSRSMTALAAFALSSTAAAAQVPPSGTFDLSAGFTAVAETIQAAERTLGHGVYWGVVFGDNPLLLTAGVCPFISEQAGDVIKLNGRCAWSDGDGDRIFTEFAGTLSLQTFDYDDEFQTITGGTGEFQGIQGDVPHDCQFVNPTQGTCVHSFNYRLP